MYLLLLVIIFISIGYLLADSPVGDKVDQTAEKAANTSKGWLERTKNWWNARFGRQKQVKTFRDWVISESAEEFPEEFTAWLESLSEEEAQDFTQALTEHADSLDFNLIQLVQGGFAHQPLLRQVFVETIVVYSDAYRKAKQAHEEAEAVESEKENQNAPKDEKQPTNGNADRRKKLNEVAETAPVG